VNLVDRKWGDRPCVIEDGHTVSYSELDGLVERLLERFARMGLARGDRIGIFARRSADVVALCVAAYRAGLTYVPADPNSPVSRNLAIHAECEVRVTFVEERFATAYEEESRRTGADIPCERLPAVGGGLGLVALLSQPVPQIGSARSAPPVSNLVHVLYTSGSTGKPKGVMISRENLRSFIEWARALILPTPEDRFGNHAQFHFGISTFDLFLSLSSGASLVIVSDEVGRHARGLLDLLERERVTVWYSTPRILSLMAQTEEVGTRDLSALRILAFAGEAFPIEHFNRLRAQLPHPRYFHMYGSTETNIMTYFEVPPDREFDVPLPIGRTAEYYQSRIVDSTGNEVGKDDEGEFVVKGPGVTCGYWRQPELTHERMLGGRGNGWYRTGDIVRPLDDGSYAYVGRADRMVKVGGYRVELGEVERVLSTIPEVREAAVTVARRDGEVELLAHLVVTDRLSVLHAKRRCAEKLPAYMVPAKIHFLDELPRTSTNKIDYQALVRRNQDVS
jgi:amino acid adenylation domain-containing protein